MNFPYINIKFQALRLIYGAIFKLNWMKNNFYTTTLSITAILPATIYTAQFRWNGLRWKNCISCELLDSLLILVYLYFLYKSELKNFLLTQLTNLLCSSLTANRLSGNIPGYLGNFTGLTYLYVFNLLHCSTISLSYSNFASNASILCSLMIISIYAIIKYRSLESNQFSGVVPPELGKLASLETL